MGFWIFMMIMNLLIPFAMIGFGAVFSKKAPKEINQIYGYRTSMSMKSRETWEFAHRYFGKIWFILGWILLPITVIAMLFVCGKDTDTVGFYGGFVCALQCVWMIVPVIFTEVALRKKFDRDGVLK